MSDLAEFLRARLDEDEEAAQAAKPGPWHADGGGVYAKHPVDEVVDYSTSADHIARHDPKRTLIEVEAKRRNIEQHGSTTGYVFDDDDDALACRCCGDLTVAYPCGTLRLLALPYADHPDYRPEWAPAG